MKMVELLQSTKARLADSKNPFDPHSKLLYVDSLLALPNSIESEKRYRMYLKSNILLELGREDDAVKLLGKLAENRQAPDYRRVLKTLGIANMRIAERSNCIHNHASQSCIFPLSGPGIHTKRHGSSDAINTYKMLLELNPNDLEAKWLLNIAYMTLGEYPKGVPPEYLVPNMEGDTSHGVRAIEDIAGDLKLDVKSTSGGSIAEDFDNDGYLDIMTSSWDLGEQVRYFKNNTDGTFSDHTDAAGLQGITGGLYMVQADYDNDGNIDVLILRGAWKGKYGKEPNSLLRNNGDGTFSDVTITSGLLSFHPTQAATWNDFNNDGWLDLFIGNESVSGPYSERHPSQLYINNQDGTFRQIARKANCNINSFIKGVTSGDYNNDGWQDIFLSTMNGERILLKNKGVIDQEVSFENVTEKARLDQHRGNTFTTWFWDYNNDGWLDIFACDYTFDKSLAYYAAAEKFNMATGNPEKILLYRNNQDGTFTNVAEEAGLNTNVFAMGSNFGDIDNDGYLDMYLGTGNPSYESIIPNRMFKSLGGESFADVTTSARVGHLQKGHAVSFADMDNDGDQDIYAQMGGAFEGDAFHNAFFLNPGQNANSWISIVLEGTSSNRSAIGTRVKATFTENGIQRSVYRDVNSGGSFGASPLRREIGLGTAQKIDKLEILWHGGNDAQVFYDVKRNQFIRITEGSDEIKPVSLTVIDWILPNRLCLPESPMLTMSEQSGKSQ